MYRKRDQGDVGVIAGRQGALVQLAEGPMARSPDRRRARGVVLKDLR
ncbi:hypothetical protein SFR_0241 [Streptomyces sp. FR-008]|nr:hypothetical protein SFR_0241 [Streptomyces sp. FR-008]